MSDLNRIAVSGANGHLEILDSPDTGPVLDAKSFHEAEFWRSMWRSQTILRNKYLDLKRMEHLTTNDPFFALSVRATITKSATA